MKILPVAASLFAFVVILSPPAQAFHPTEETYGYVMPKKFRHADRDRRANVSEPEFSSDSWFNSKPSKKNKFSAKSMKVGPDKMDGGGKPYIGAAAPAKVSFPNSYGAGTIVIDTAGRKLYYVLSSSSAYRYPIAVGKAGFAWTGTQKISRKVAWPDWRPPSEMLERKPYLPKHMTGGIRNPLGAMALYLGNSLYRIHGTNDVKSIGTAASSGCIRMTNGHVMHLSKIAGVGTTVRVLSKLPSRIANAGASG